MYMTGPPSLFTVASVASGTIWPSLLRTFSWPTELRVACGNSPSAMQIHLPGAAKQVEQIDIVPAHVRLQRVEHVGTGTISDSHFVRSISTYNCGVSARNIDEHADQPTQRIGIGGRGPTGRSRSAIRRDRQTRAARLAIEIRRRCRGLELAERETQ